MTKIFKCFDIPPFLVRLPLHKVMLWFLQRITQNKVKISSVGGVMGLSSGGRDNDDNDDKIIKKLDTHGCNNPDVNQDELAKLLTDLHQEQRVKRQQLLIDNENLYELNIDSSITTFRNIGKDFEEFLEHYAINRTGLFIPSEEGGVIFITENIVQHYLLGVSVTTMGLGLVVLFCINPFVFAGSHYYNMKKRKEHFPGLVELECNKGIDVRSLTDIAHFYNPFTVNRTYSEELARSEQLVLGATTDSERNAYRRWIVALNQERLHYIRKSTSRFQAISSIVVVGGLLLKFYKNGQVRPKKMREEKQE